MPNYCVHVTSRRNCHYFDILAQSPDEASICAVQEFFFDYPGSQDVRVVSVEEFTGQIADNSDYNPYHSCDTSQGSEYTSYASHTDVNQQQDVCSGYTPYSSKFSSGNTAAVAGFTTELPVAPVLETSYHKPLPNGYAPYRSFRVILPS